MPETVELVAEDEIIKVRSFGETTIAEWRRSLKTVVDLAEQTGYRTVLVDTTEQTDAPSIIDVFDFASDLPQELTFAVVLSQRTPDAIRFFETVALNRVKLVRLFDDVDKAIRWLKAA